MVPKTSTSITSIEKPSKKLNLIPTTEKEVHSVSMRLKNSKAYDIFHISTHVIETIAPLTTKSITHMFNHSQEEDPLINAINKSLGLFIDLSKAFDLVDHEIFLRKLYRTCIRGIALERFRSYLRNRKLSVYVNTSSGVGVSGSASIQRGYHRAQF
ncbi:UNVERIFIED_CONTAM: hypothetical protein B566_EDAN018778 [Ephemera danica]|nr:hypothetical protein B566_EDAN018778 [Ephemera danica]